MPLHSRGIAATAAYLATVPAANLLTTHAGDLPVGGALTTPAGVLAAGAALALRDLVHAWAGRTVALSSIAAGSALACLLAPPQLAVASAAAFAAAELADTAVYTPLRERGLLLAVAASNAVGLLIDSVLFAWLALGSLAAVPGLVLAKVYLTVAVVAVLAVTRPLLTGRRA